jgi:preprotein translocase subunit SecG
MTALSIILNIVLILISIVLIAVVLMQQGQRQGLGAIAGGAETFFGKNKAKTANAWLSRATTIITIIFVILVLVLYIIQPEVNPEDLYAQMAQDSETTENVEAEEENADAAPEIEVDAELDFGEETEGEVATEDDAVVETEPVAEETADTAADAE